MLTKLVLSGLLIVLIYLVANYLFLTKEGIDVKGYKNYGDSNNDTEMKILVYKNAGNISALKDAVDGLLQNTGRISALEKQFDALNNTLQATKTMAEETKTNVEGAVTEYKASGDQQTAELNTIDFGGEKEDEEEYNN